MSSVIVHYQELALKGRNRPWFVHTLVRTIRRALSDLPIEGVRALMGRLEIKLGPDAPWPVVRERLAGLPGIGNFSLATHVAPDLDLIINGILANLGDRPSRPFRIAARRADKRFPYPSPEIERLVGRRVQEATGWPVNLEHPEFVIHVEVVTNDAFYYFDRDRGPGGLPTGTSGKVACLISGGIDSPVAAWRMMRRGCRVSFIHFHSYPILSRTSQDKVRTMVELLTRHQLRSRLFLVPFAPVQQQIVVSVPSALRVVIYRRLMLRIAERIAYKNDAHALVTGDCVGQVASQTVENLGVIGSVVRMPLLRPLVGFDKEEITAEAEKLGTYRTSVIPDEDCCTLFTPRYPATRARHAAAALAEAELDVAGLVERAADAAVVEDFRFPDDKIVRLAEEELTGDLT